MTSIYLQVDNYAATLDDQQRELHMDLDLPTTGRYVFLIAYVTTGQGQRSYVNVHVQPSQQGDEQKGHAVLYDCTLTISCRQVVTDNSGQIVYFDLPSTLAHVILRAEDFSSG